MGIEEILADTRFDAFIDALIVFFISLVTNLLALPGIPAFENIYHALLVAFLAFLIFWAKKRGVNYIVTPKGEI